MSLQDFKEYELYPALWDRVPQAFPELGFVFKGGYWRSSKHIDGSSSHSADQTFIHHRRKDLIKDQTGSAMSLIDYVMQRDRCDFIRAMEILASVCGLSLPNTDTEEYREYQERQERRQKALSIFKAALWSDEALPVREQLKARGWSDEEIKSAELGYISPSIKEQLNDSDFNVAAIGTTNRLVIPFRTGTRLQGFKFRATDEAARVKYMNSLGLSKASALCYIGVGCNDATVVEGELDALHAIVRGASNVVATTGGAITEAQVKDALRRGVKRFTLLFDNDAKGLEFTASSIRIIEGTGASCYIATLPAEYKDTDEYLKSHSIEQWQRVIDEAAPAYMWKLQRIIDGYASKGDELTHKDREDFFKQIEALLNDKATRVEDREMIYTTLKLSLSPDYVNVDEFRAYVDRAYMRKLAKQRADEIQRASTEITELLTQHKVDEALSVMRRTSQEQTATEKASEFARVFAPRTAEEYMSMLSEVKDGIPTGFIFKDDKHSTELKLNAGLTFVCAYRGHGKTTFLNNIALNEAQRNRRLNNAKSVLYFSYEVNKRRLVADMLNTYVNDKYISKNPYETILSTFKVGAQAGKQMFTSRREDGKTRDEAYNNYCTKRDEFFREYLCSGALVIVDENYKVGELLEAIKYYINAREVSLVCIDYAQLIYSEDFSRARTEEIKQVVNQIKDYANKAGIPFVLAAQFNREVDSPVSVDTKNIGEGGDFERIADTVIGLFNLKELHPLPRNDKEEKAAQKLLTALGVATYQQGETLKPIEGKLFCRLLKRRYGYFPIDMVFDWEGRTKRIEPNCPEALLGEDAGDEAKITAREQVELFPF